MYDKLVASFSEDSKLLNEQPSFAEKENELNTKFKKEEGKKIDKLIRKEMNEWDSLYNGNPALS